MARCCGWAAGGGVAAAFAGGLPGCGFAAAFAITAFCGAGLAGALPADFAGGDFGAGFAALADGRAVAPDDLTDFTEFDTGLALVGDLAATLVGLGFDGTALAAAFFGGSLLFLAIAFYTPSVVTTAVSPGSLGALHARSATTFVRAGDTLATALALPLAYEWCRSAHES